MNIKEILVVMSFALPTLVVILVVLGLYIALGYYSNVLAACVFTKLGKSNIFKLYHFYIAYGSMILTYVVVMNSRGD